MKFTIRGHKNLLSKHGNTIEFTKDKDLTHKGDCIVGVNANFKNLKPLLKNKRIRVTIKAGKLKDSFTCYVNPKFNHKSEIVFRRSDFLDKRTLGIKADKAAVNLNRKLVSHLKNPKHKATVEITPIQIKNFIFDFDDTLIDASPVHVGVIHKLDRFFKNKYKKNEFGKAFDEVDKEAAIQMRTKKDTRLSNRSTWAKVAAKRLGINISKKQADEIKNLYWNYYKDKSKLLPSAKSVLIRLKKKHTLFILTDADGENPNLKKSRIKAVGIYKFFKGFALGDVLHTTKPDMKFYNYLEKNYGVKPEETIMVGDKPQKDLILAKEIGMTTVWMKFGRWSDAHRGFKFPYVDYEIENLKELLKIIK